MSNALIIMEHDNNTLHSSNLHVIYAAQQLNVTIHVLVAGKDCQQVAEQAASLEGVSKVLLSDDNANEHFLAENIASLVKDISEPYQYVLSSSSTKGKDLMPRIAALLDVNQISDIISITSEDTFERPIYAGSAIASVQSTDERKVITVRISAFESVAKTDKPVDIESIDAAKDIGLSKMIDLKTQTSDRPALDSADIVCSGGRGFKDQAAFDQIYALADCLNAAVGASRAAVDAGLASNDMQVGQTGKIVAPKLYIAVGISGAIQHLAGMKDSKIIVAINLDEEAPIFEIADYALKMDLNEAMPQLIAALKG